MKTVFASLEKSLMSVGSFLNVDYLSSIIPTYIGTSSLFSSVSISKYRNKVHKGIEAVVLIIFMPYSCLNSIITSWSPFYSITSVVTSPDFINLGGI
jgi:hypothetical protein